MPVRCDRTGNGLISWAAQGNRHSSPTARGGARVDEYGPAVRCTTKATDPWWETGSMQPEELYELDAEETSDLDGAALLVHLEGFMDAGAAGRLLTEHLLDAFEHKTVAKFDVDRLLDYRSRRPLMTFDGGTWESYDAPELTVFRLADSSGKPFLLL